MAMVAYAMINKVKQSWGLQIQQFPKVVHIHPQAMM